MSNISREDDLKDLEERTTNGGDRPHTALSTPKTNEELIKDNEDELRRLKKEMDKLNS